LPACTSSPPLVPAIWSGLSVAGRRLAQGPGFGATRSVTGTLTEPLMSVIVSV
jgi:hypothetical protein